MQQPLPGQTNRQQVHDVLVVTALQARLPAFVRAPGGPAVDVHQQRAEVGRAALFRNRHRVQSGGDQRLRLGRHRRQPRPQHSAALAPRQAVVAGELLAPTAVQAGCVVHSPGRLVVVEEGSAMLADLVGDQLGPALTRARRRTGVAHIGDQRHAQHRRRLALHFRDQSCHPVRRAARLATGLDRSPQVLARDATCGPLRAEPLARHRQPRAGQCAQRGRRLRHRTADPAPIGVDGDELVQRPGRGDATGCAVDVFGQALGLQQVGFDGRVHAWAPVVVTSVALPTLGKAVVTSLGAGGRHRPNATRLNFSSRNRPP